MRSSFTSRNLMATESYLPRPCSMLILCYTHTRARIANLRASHPHRCKLEPAACPTFLYARSNAKPFNPSDRKVLPEPHTSEHDACANKAQLTTTASLYAITPRHRCIRCLLFFGVSLQETLTLAHHFYDLLRIAQNCWLLLLIQSISSTITRHSLLEAKLR